MFTDSQQLRLSSGRDLPGNQPEPCCKLSAFGECGAVADRCHHRRSCERPDTRHSQKPFARSILVRDSTDFAVELFDIDFDLTPFADKHPEQPEEGPGEPVLRFCQYSGEFVQQMLPPGAHHQTPLQKKRTELIDHARPALDQPISYTMNRLEIQLICRFYRNESHSWALHRFRNRLSIDIIVFLRFNEWPDELGRNQAQFVPECRYFPREMVRAAARFHADQAGRRIRQQRYQLSSGRRFFSVTEPR